MADISLKTDRVEMYRKFYRRLLRLTYFTETTLWHTKPSELRHDMVINIKAGTLLPSPLTIKGGAISTIQYRQLRAARTRAARQPRSLDMTLAFGRADLLPECKVTTKGYKAEIDATRWLIAEVTHNWAECGFTTGLKLEPA